MMKTIFDFFSSWFVLMRGDQIHVWNKSEINVLKVVWSKLTKETDSFENEDFLARGQNYITGWLDYQTYLSTSRHLLPIYACEYPTQSLYDGNTFVCVTISSNVFEVIWYWPRDRNIIRYYLWKNSRNHCKIHSVYHAK